MKKLSFIGDSITEMLRSYSFDLLPVSYGAGFVYFIESALSTKYPKQFEIYNKASGGRTIAHVYAGAKTECWNLKPDLVNIEAGINEIRAEFYNHNGLNKEEYEKMYTRLLVDTKAYCGDIPIVLIKPYYMLGTLTMKDYPDVYRWVQEYGKIVEKVGGEFGCFVISMQEIFDEYAKKYSPAYISYDGVHPTVAGSKLIADEWLKVFEKIIKEREL